MNTYEHTREPATRTSRWRYLGWVHLIYFVIPLFEPFFDPAAGAWSWVLAIAVIGAGMALYLLGYRRPELARWYSSIPLALLAVATMPFNVGASILLVYSAAVIGKTESGPTAIRAFAALTVVLLVASPLIPAPLPWRWWSVVPSLIFIWIIGLTTFEEAKRERVATELRTRNAHIEHLATVTERERIARDLHDLLGHSLTAVVMRAQLIGADPARAIEEAAEIERTAREALTEVRNALSGWRQANFDDELESARGALDSLGIELLVQRDPDLVLVGSAEHELALALREAVTNVARHAKAKTCRVAIAREDGELRLVIADDGIGGKSRDGNGLTGMRERVTALGGRMNRVVAAGTTVTIAVPIKVAM